MTNFDKAMGRKEHFSNPSRKHFCAIKAEHIIRNRCLKLFQFVPGSAYWLGGLFNREKKC